MLFLMLVCQDSVPVPPPSGPAGGDVEQWVTTMDGRGVRVTGDALASEGEAVAVRVREDQLQVTEGAFLDTKGALLGFDVLECQDMAEAVQVASAHPLARRCVLRSAPHLPTSRLHRDQHGIGPLVYLSLTAWAKMSAAAASAVRITWAYTRKVIAGSA